MFCFRVKHSHSSLDAQTISTFDSSNGDNPGFYHKYASAWSQLQNSAAMLHSGSYKPAATSVARMPPEVHHHHSGYEHHFHSRTRLNNNGAINEGFRDSNEITLNADVYTRSASGGSNGSSESGGKRGRHHQRGNAGDQEWQQLTRSKY